MINYADDMKEKEQVLFYVFLFVFFFLFYSKTKQFFSVQSTWPNERHIQ